MRQKVNREDARRMNRRRYENARLRLLNMLELNAPDVIIKRASQAVLERLYGGTWRAIIGIGYNRVRWSFESFRDDVLFWYKRYVLRKSTNEIFGVVSDDEKFDKRSRRRS